MSDRELVQIDTNQFAALLLRLDDVANRIGPSHADFSLHQVLTHLETTLNKIATAMSGGDNSQVLTAINNLDRKVSEFMATQEERLQTIQAGLAGVAEGVNTLQQQIADLKASNPALDDEISAIEATVKGIADDINGVTEPPTEPPVEG